MNQKPLRTLFFWAIWAATSMIVYVTLYRDTEAFEFLKHDPSKITWLIVGLFALGVLASFILALLLTFEHIGVTAIHDVARDKGLHGIEFKSRRRAVARFFHGLKTALTSSGEPDVEALLNLELGAYQRVSHSIEVAGNLLITLGLIGTVAGLTLTLTGLTGSLEALGHDQEMLLSGLRKAMAGMGTAFYTTLLGAVLGGVLLRVFAQITDHSVHALFDSVMRICLVYCSADFKPSLERDIRALKSELQALTSHVESVENAFASSRHAIAGFREELTQLRKLDVTDEEHTGLHELVKLQSYYSELLRQEIRMINRVNNPWRKRVRQFLFPNARHD